MKLGAATTALGAALIAGWATSTALLAPSPDDLGGLVVLAARTVAGPIVGPALVLAGLSLLLTAPRARPSAQGSPQLPQHLEHSRVR